MLTANIENMLVTSIVRTMETGFLPTQYIVIIPTVRLQSEVCIQRWIDVVPFVNFWLGCDMSVVLTILRSLISRSLKNYIVDFVNHFRGSHFYWTSHTMFIFCGCTVTFKFIYTIVNYCKHTSRSTMNFIQLSFDLF